MIGCSNKELSDEASSANSALEKMRNSLRNIETDTHELANEALRVKKLRGDCQ